MVEAGPIKVIFHDHKFKFLGVSPTKWYCDGLTNNPSKKCYSGQKAVFEIQKEAQYKCEKGCNITLCKPCIESLTDYQVPKVKTYHQHELHYRISTFRKWYCDGLADKGTCERNHKKEFLVRSHPFYECLDGCNFMLCDSCTSKYDVAKQYVAQVVDDEKTKPIQPRRGQKQAQQEEAPKKSATQVISPQIDQSVKPVDYKSLPITKSTSLSDVSWLNQNFGDDLRVIGKGGFGEVFLGSRKENGSQVDRAVKVMETMDVTILNQSIQELMNLSRLKNHPNIMSYENYFMNPIPLANGKVTYQIFIEMELATSSLDKMIEQHKDKLSEDLIVEILGQILTGLRYAHSQQCAHLDLKPENVLVVGKTMKIADWGGSLILKSGSSTKLKSKSLAVTRGYVAPEIDCEEFGSTETFNYYLCDVYSLGILCFRCCGVPIKEIAGIPKNKQKFHDATMEDFISDYLEGKYSKELISLVKDMTVFDPSKRPNIQQVIDLYHKTW